MLIALFIFSAITLILAYRYYGAFLERRCAVDPERTTPAEQLKDGVDYVPTRASILFGHHFSSIAGAGPIVGPIIAAAAFGWLPTSLWILLGAIFVGGVHDFGSTFLSVRSRGQSITATCRRLIGQRTGKLFLCFVILALIYVLAVFLDLTVAGFIQQPAVATASGWFVIVAFIFGWLIRKTQLPSLLLIPCFILLTYAGLWLGVEFPLTGISKSTLLVAALIYCYVAAILPVAVLMQPRDFLSATFLYAIMLLGLLGVFVRGGGLDLPAFTQFEPSQLNYLVPFLFITVACGACSGFHSIVSSGTTAKQIQSEADIKKISYGGMLVEGLLAVFALACVGVVGGLEGGPVATFARGAAVFFDSLGIPQSIGLAFATLAVSTFLLTTLDTCTRLTRFLLEELFQWRSASSRYLGTLIVLILPACAAFGTYTTPEGVVLPVWKAIWPLFGATNQLLAALALMTFLVYLKQERIRAGFVWWPALMMATMPLLGLSVLCYQYGPFSLLGSIAMGMIALGLYLLMQSLRFCWAQKS